MTTLFLYAIGLGVAYCAPPGAVNAESIRRGLARGFWASARVQAGSLIGDVAWAIVALLGIAYLVQNDSVRLALGAAGVLLLAWLAYSALRDAWLGREPAATANGSRGDFATGATLSLANPWGVAFWLGVGGAVVSASMGEPAPDRLAAFLAGFVLGAAIWCATLSTVVGWGRRFVGRALFRWVNLGCGLALACFAARFALSLIPALAGLL